MFAFEWDDLICFENLFCYHDYARVINLLYIGMYLRIIAYLCSTCNWFSVCSGERARMVGLKSYCFFFSMISFVIRENSGSIYSLCFTFHSQFERWPMISRVVYTTTPVVADITALLTLVVFPVLINVHPKKTRARMKQNVCTMTETKRYSVGL